MGLKKISEWNLLLGLCFVLESKQKGSLIFCSDDVFFMLFLDDF